MLLWLLGCPAEMLGIPVPKRGPDAISMDDLVRDVAKLSEGETASAEDQRLAFLDERWRQMRLVPEEGGRCGRQPGPTKLLVRADGWTAGEVRTFTPAAVAISIAKAFDGGKGLLFCVGASPSAPKILGITLGPAGDDPSVAEFLTIRPEGPEGLDYRRLEASAKEGVGRVEHGLSP